MKNRTNITILLSFLAFTFFVAANNNWRTNTPKLIVQGTSTMKGTATFEDAATFADTVTVAGTATFNGATAFSGANTFSTLATFGAGATFTTLTTSGVATFGGQTTVNALAQFNGLTNFQSAATFNSTLNIDHSVIHTMDTEEITSPTLTIDVSGLSFVILNSDENITGVTLVNGVVGQIVLFITGSGSNTIRFDDDGINMALGANITLTEGQSDSLTLVNNATGDWAAVAAKDN